MKAFNFYIISFSVYILKSNKSSKYVININGMLIFFIKKHEIASDVTDNLQGKKCNVSFYYIEKALKKKNYYVWWR